MAPLHFRSAVPSDLDAVAELVHGAPGREAVALLGGAEPARRLGFALTRLQARRGGWERTVVAEQAGRVVGVLQWRLAGESALPAAPLLAWTAVRALGPWGAARAGLRERVRRRVQPPPPPDAFHVEELHVRSALRNRGIGAALLAHAEGLARARGFARMSLVTHTENPAQRLYRRAGFEETCRREDAEYRRLTGIAGRLLMVKRLEPERAGADAGPVSP